MNSVRNRLAALFFAITAAAIGFIYLYVVPQLRSSLTAEKLSRLEEVGTEQTQRIATAIDRGDSEARVRRALRSVAQETDARVTVLGVRQTPSGAQREFSRPSPDEGEDEVGELARTFHEMQQRLARLDSARREFIANASHERRTPIFSLGGFMELLEDEDLDPASRAEFVRTMRE